MPAADTAAPTLDESARQALIELVVRGMRRGESAPEIDVLTERGLAVAKGPMTMPTPRGTEVVRAALRLEER